MNKVILMGRLTRDPEVRYSQASQPLAIARFNIAVNRRIKQQGQEQAADFISCVAFGKNGELVEKYLKKGTKIVLVGRIQTSSYTNREGQKVYTTEVVCEEFDFAESRNASEGSSSEDRPEPIGQMNENGFMYIPDGIEEELPFS